MSSAAAPPSAQCCRWWASQATGGRGAVREGAVPVADHQRLPDRGRDQAVRPTDVEHLRPATQHHGQDLGVAGHPSRRSGGQPRVEVAEPGAVHPVGQPLTESVVVDGDHDRRTGSVRAGRYVGVRETAAGLDQRVNIRAPWSRGSRPSWVQSATPHPCAGRVGSPPQARASVVCGAAMGSSTLLSQAASSTVPRPFTRTPPMPSSATDRKRP